MSLRADIKERRLLPLMGTYLVTGFVALEGVDQLVGNEILPAIAYRIALVIYLFGVPGSLSIAWFHGAKGRQKATRAEIVIQGVLLVLALATVSFVVRNHREELRLQELAAASGVDATSIAVLYFEDLSRGELEPVADGLTESLIDQLSEVRSLDVVSRNGVRPYRGTDVDPDSIARALSVGTVIRGSVEQDGDELVITARLVDGLSGADVDRRVFEIPAGLFLAARDSLAENVARLLRRGLGEEVRLRETRGDTDSDEAWSLVQRAERLRTQAEAANREGDPESAISLVATADSLLARAETADPDWVRPPARRAHLGFRRAFFTATGLGDYDLAGDEIATGVEHADRALAMEPRDADALEQRGSLRYLQALLGLTADGDETDRFVAEARDDLEAATEADPTRATAYSILSHLYLTQDDDVSVVLAARRAYEEDAYLEDADRVLRRLFWAHYNLEQFREARAWCERGRQQFPDNLHFVECELWLMNTPLEDPDVERAWQTKAVLDSLAGDPYRERVGNLLVAGVILASGLADSAEAVFVEGRAEESIDPNRELLWQEAALRSIHGDPDGAVDLLRLWRAATDGTIDPQYWWWRPLADREDIRALLTP
jgi:serine/threonine-protein kinase